MFPERLREARKAKNLSQKKMASLLFLSQQAYAKYEVGTAKPNSETLAKIAAALDVSVDYLLGIQPETSARQNGK
jgi:transcriptional regulator with XRE-family HTH domain